MNFSNSSISSSKAISKNIIGFYFFEFRITIAADECYYKGSDQGWLRIINGFSDQKTKKI